MEFRIKLPAPALEVENLIRVQCQHFGYPEAVLSMDPSSSELVLKLHDPSPLSPSKPVISVESSGIPRLQC